MAAADTPEEPRQFRRTQTVLGPVGMVLLFGLLGLAWWWWRHRPGCPPATHLRRVRAALVVAPHADNIAGTTTDGLTPDE